jgi:hypothetical protein
MVSILKKAPSQPASRRRIFGLDEHQKGHRVAVIRRSSAWLSGALFATASRLVVCTGVLLRRGSVVDRFIARQNIEHFRQLLAQARDPEERARLERFLSEATEQLRQAEEAFRRDPPKPTG